MKRSLFYFILFCLVIISGCVDESERNALKVMTLNLRFDNPADSSNAWPHRAAVVCDMIRDIEPDVFGMQEVLWSQYEYLDSVLTGYSSVGAGRDNGARLGEMNPLFFRKDKFDIARSLTFWLSEEPEVPGSVSWGSSLPRIVTWMELVDKSSGQHFFCFNTHFAHDSDSARVMSSRMLLGEVGRIAEGFPFIITGDFNMLPGSTGYDILTGPAESVPLIADSYNISNKKPSGPSYTFNAFSDRPGSGRIDFILVRNGMKVFDHMTVLKKGNGVFISDHWPVTALVAIR